MSGKITFTYWPLHGLGAAARMALHFAGVEFNDVLVGSAAEWFGPETTALAAKNALVNLPHLETESGDVIVQSQAILRHIGRTQALYGKSEQDAARVDQVMDSVVELRTEFYKMAYAAEGDFAAMKASFADVSFDYYYGGLERFMAANKTKYAAADSVTVADFVIIDQMANVTTVYGEADVAFAKYPALLAYYQELTAKPELRSYYASAAAALPYNAPGARISACVTLN
jgi:glutathione S-transferase